MTTLKEKEYEIKRKKISEQSKIEVYSLILKRNKNIGKLIAK